MLPVRVLLIDDEEDMFVIVRRLLARSEHEKFEVSWRPSYEKGLEALRRGLHDVCLLDFRLGEKNGLDLLREATADGCHEPFILLTARGDEEIDLQAMRAGASDYLVKDEIFDGKLLQRAIRYVLQHARILEQVASNNRISTLEEMSASIAHEVNNPASIIHAVAQRLSQILVGPEPDLQKAINHCAKIEKAAARIVGIVHSLRNLATGKAGDSPSKVAVQPLIEDTLAICQQRFESGAVKLHAPSLLSALEVEGRGVELSQVLLNLLNNAYDAVESLPERWVRLEVNVQEGSVEISVTDSGSGVPEEHRAKIMKPFYTTKPKNKGTGLGLSISRKLVQNNGGELSLDVESENTRFVVRLPRTCA